MKLNIKDQAFLIKQEDLYKGKLFINTYTELKGPVGAEGFDIIDFMSETIPEINNSTTCLQFN